MFCKTVIIVELAILVIMMSGCAKENSATEAVNINLQLGTYTTAQNKFVDLLLPKANASVASLKMCFKRLRFKLAETGEDSPSSGSDDSVSKKSGADDNLPHNSEDSTTEDNIDLNIGEVTVSSTATQLGTIQVPAGVYRRIEFDLDNGCGSGKSISLINNFGSFTSTEHITIKFDGRFEANMDGTLTLGVQQILNKLNSYNGTGSLKSAIEPISGVLSN